MTAETIENSSDKTRLTIGSTSRCIDSNCTGWYVDSFAGKYWIQCLDSKHNVNERGRREGTASTANSSNSNHHQIQMQPPSRLQEGNHNGN
jgi:hypothetical protein